MATVRSAWEGDDYGQQVAGNMDGSLRVLVVEDETLAARRLCKLIDRIMRQLFATTASDAAPAHILCLTSPEQACDALDLPHDLLFLDLNLCGFNSLEWVRQKRADPGRTIIVSADTRYADEAFALGIFAYVFKPVDEDLLARHVERYLRHRHLVA